MTARASFRQSDLARAIKAYRDATGTMPVVQIVAGRAILTGESVEAPKPEGNSCDDAFGVQP